MPATQRKSLTLSLHNIYETLAISWPTVVDAAFNRVNKKTCDARLDSWCKHVVENARIDVDVKGRENMARGTTYLVMSNHQSLYDVPVLFYVIGPNLRMITKVELFKVPVFGPAIREAGFIAIDRSNRTRAIASLQVAKQALADGVHVWISPEGTRSKTGALLPFKKGGFALALEAGLPILPVALVGTRNILRAKGLRSSAGASVKVTILPPIDATKYATTGKGADHRAARERLMADVQRSIQSGL